MMSVFRWTKASVLMCSMLASEPVSRLSTQITRWPRASSSSHKWEPRNPAPPVTSEVGIARGIYSGFTRNPVPARGSRRARRLSRQLRTGRHRAERGAARPVDLHRRHVLGVVTGGEMPAGILGQRRLDRLADVGRVRTARVEAATRRG